MRPNGAHVHPALRRGGLFFLVLVIFFVSALPVFSQTASEKAAALIQPDEQEFPQWALDLRRAEIIMFGSLPFAWFIATLGVDLYRSATHDWIRGYWPWPLKENTVPMTNDEYFMCIGIAAGIAVTISVVDFFINTSKRNKVRVDKWKDIPGKPIIIRTPMTNENVQPPEINRSNR
ncbi:hypothetical protein FACS1894190_12750 [Spirochaetia bacterium]|nr:hypothetical protein FACS1894190_12750 [Spirochaetia bacterium]